MSDLGTDSRPLRVAIVGSGPSGFYAVEALQKAEQIVKVDMFDRLPTPFGLVRYGVAPDHQKIKNVIRIYDKLALDENFSFYGNVTVGKDISIEELAEYYDAVILASGAETDRKLGIPGEDLEGSYTATAFVAWYNGHPDYADMKFDLSQETAVIIGQGNVAVDVCRILAKTPEELKESDIAQHALDVLAKSKIKNIYMIGRRGPVQAKFTVMEIKEMGKLEACAPVVNSDDMVLDAASQEELDDKKNKGQQRIVAILNEFAERDSSNADRQLHIQFKKGPKEILGDGHVEKIVLETNELTGEPFKIKANGTGKTEELPCGLVFRSVGYRGVAMDGVPFDDWNGVFANEDGRIVEDGKPVPGLYVVGWIKRGPSGVVGTNKPCSQTTVAHVLEDLERLTPCATPDSAAVAALLIERGIQLVSFEDWKKVDAIEVERGEAVGKPREKMTSVSEMLEAIKG